MTKQIAFSLATLVALTAATAASAATVRFSWDYDSFANTFHLFAEELDGPGDNGGIASYGVVLTGVLNVDHNSPRDGFAQGPGGVGPAGFTSLRSADNVPVLLASQDTITPTPNLIYGFGQAGNSFAALSINDFTGGTQLEQASWDAKLRIATGTIAPGVVPGINATSVDTFANVFVQGSGTATRAASIQIRPVECPLAGPCIPEPTTYALMGLGLAAVVGLRRRRYGCRIVQ